MDKYHDWIMLALFAILFIIDSYMTAKYKNETGARFLVFDKELETLRARLDKYETVDREHNQLLQ